jgi:hypothetical protein
LRSSEPPIPRKTARITREIENDKAEAAAGLMGLHVHLPAERKLSEDASIRREPCDSNWRSRNANRYVFDMLSEGITRKLANILPYEEHDINQIIFNDQICTNRYIYHREGLNLMEWSLAMTLFGRFGWVWPGGVGPLQGLSLWFSGERCLFLNFSPPWACPSTPGAGWIRRLATSVFIRASKHRLKLSCVSAERSLL